MVEPNPCEPAAGVGDGLDCRGQLHSGVLRLRVEVGSEVVALALLLAR